MSPIEHAPTETNGTIAAPEQDNRYVVHSCAQGLFFSLGTAAKILDARVQPAAFHRRHGRRRLWRQGRFAHRTAGDARRDADRAAGALRARSRGGDAARLAARRRAHVCQGRRDARRPHRRAPDPLLFRCRRLYAALVLRRGQMHGAPAGPLLDPECLVGHLLSSYTNRCPSTAMRGFGITAVDFALEVQMDKLAHAVEHGPDGIPHPQRLSRWRHEGASARRQEHGADRMRAGRGGEGELADLRERQAASSLRAAAGRARANSRHADRSARADRPARDASGPSTQTLPAGTMRIPLTKQPELEGSRDARPAAPNVPRYEPARPMAQPAVQAPAPLAPMPPAAPPPSPARRHQRRPLRHQPQHGAMRFSSVFGTRRR